MHTQDKPLPYREILSKLREFGVQEIKRKGVKRMLYHPDVNGRPASYPMDIHKESQVFSRPVVRAIRNRFNIPLEQFYSR